MNYPTIESRNYTNDRSSAEAIAVGAAYQAVRDGDCQNMRVIRELDALEALLAGGEASESEVAEAEQDVMTAWQSYSASL